METHLCTSGPFQSSHHPLRDTEELHDEAHHLALRESTLGPRIIFIGDATVVDE